MSGEMASPVLSSDQDAGALYLRFSDEPVVGTIELSRSVYVDVDVEGNAVGFEVLDADVGLLETLERRSQPVLLFDLLDIEPQ